MGCSDYTGHFNSLYCAYTKNGCLFNLKKDPCEKTDRGDLEPEIREYFINALEEYQRNTPEPLMLYIDKLNYSAFAPELYCLEDDFWCPTMEYEFVEFEDKLASNFLKFWPVPYVNSSASDASSTASESDLFFGFSPKSMTSVLAVFLMLAVLFIARSTRCGRSCMKVRDEHTPLLISDINPLMF